MTRHLARFGIQAAIILNIAITIVTTTAHPVLPIAAKGKLVSGKIEANGIPGFTSGLIASTPVISPLNNDGIDDVVDLTFTPSSNGSYNYTIEEDARQIDARSRYTSVAGSSSKLLMLNSLNIEYAINHFEYKVYARESTDLGLTWTNPVETNLSDYYLGYFHNGASYRYLDLAFNSSENSYILGTVCAPSNPYTLRSLRFFKSFDGINWTLLNEVNIFSNIYSLTFDMALSGNNSEILAAVTSNNGSSNCAYFLKIRNNGQDLVITKLDMNPGSVFFTSPAIAVSTSGIVLCMWYAQESGIGDYMLCTSINFGATWDTPVKIDASRGIPIDPLVSPTIIGHESRQFQMIFDGSGRVDAVMVFNRTRIYTLLSTDNGMNWVNFTLYRAYSVQSDIYSLDYKYLGDGNTSLTFTSALAGNHIGQSMEFYTYASSFFLRPRIVAFARDLAMQANMVQSFTWNGRDELGKIVRDGIYIVRVFIENASHVVYPLPSVAVVKVDNAGPGIVLTISNPFFSPRASPGMKDTTDISLSTTADGDYNIFIDGFQKIRPETRVTTNDAIDFHADVAMDNNARLWCTYASYQDQVKGVYLKYSDDYGLSWSAPSLLAPLSEGFGGDDSPTIAIRGKTIFIVFSRLRYDEWGNSARIDLFLVKSTDLGKTWNEPVNITNAQPTGSDFYKNPDIVITNNGTLFVAYYRYALAWGVRQAEIKRSSDGGTTFSTPVIVFTETGSDMWTMDRPVNLAFNEGSNILYLMTENATGSYMYVNTTAQLWQSGDWGATWSMNGYMSAGWDWRYLRGLTLDILPNGTMQSLVLIINATAKIAWLQSQDLGISWAVRKTIMLDDVQEGDFNSPPYVTHQDMRSGRSPRGDIFYVYSRSPAARQNRDVYLFSFTATEAHFRGSVMGEMNKTVTWNGLDMWGSNCDERIYNVSAIMTDTAGNSMKKWGTCTVDNSLPHVHLVMPRLDQMRPSRPQTVALANGTGIVDYTVEIYYQYDVSGYKTFNMTFNGTCFVYIIPAFPDHEISFYFVVTDHAGNVVIIDSVDGNPLLYTYIPAFPSFSIEYPWNVIVVLISLSFGLMLGVIQTQGKRSTTSRVQARFIHMLETYGKVESSSVQASSSKQFKKALAAARKQRASMAEAKGLGRGRLMYNVMTIGTLACILAGILATYVLGNGGLALVVSAVGLLLASLAFMERVNIDASDSIYIDKRPKNLLAGVHVALIIVVLVVFILAAPLVEWFNYYVVKQTFTIGPISIPRLYLSLVTPVITSVALILFTSYHDLKNVLKRLELARVSGESWKVIWQQKEETVSKLASNVALKIFIFLVTVSFAVISTTQIGRYAEQGMLILLPFVIGWLGVFLLGTAIVSSKSTVKDALRSWIIEKTKTCPQCKATNLFESQHCTACGATFAGTTSIIERTIECKQCKERSPEGSVYCRGCGLKF
ncbi:MAG: hypothetical protein Q6373_011500 [Candidatus Sigynarchaeota archaeon]